MGWDGFEEIVAIADAGSFVGAASLLGLSTSHISRVVTRLEKQLDTQIFHRTTRRVVLTDTGRAFVERCRGIIQERDELLAQMSGTGEPQGDLRITCSVALGEKFVAPIVRQFTESHPRLAVTLDLTNRVVDIIGEGYDLGVRTGQVIDSRLAGRQIASRPFETCASPAYLKHAGLPLSIDALQEHQCLLGTNLTWHFLERGVPRILSPQARWRCNSGSAVVDAVLADMGICQLPAFYVRDHIASGRLRGVLEKSRAEPEPIWVVYPHRRQLLPKVKNLADALERILRDALNR